LKLLRQLPLGSSVEILPQSPRRSGLKVRACLTSNVLYDAVFRFLNEPASSQAFINPFVSGVAGDSGSFFKAFYGAK
jgi:hypothetical protein